MNDEKDDGLGNYTPPQLLEILRKVYPEGYGHIVWHIRTLLKLRWLMPKEKHKGCSGELLAPAAVLKLKEDKEHAVCSGK